MVCDDGSYTHLDPVERLQYKQPQATVEFVKVDDPIEIRARYCPGVVAAIETLPIGNSSCCGYVSAGLLYSMQKEHPPI